MRFGVEEVFLNVFGRGICYVKVFLICKWEVDGVEYGEKIEVRVLGGRLVFFWSIRVILLGLMVVYGVVWM